MMFTKGFVRNRAGRVVVPSNFFPSLDLKVFDTLAQVEAIIRRDFDAKARWPRRLAREAYRAGASPAARSRGNTTSRNATISERGGAKVSRGMR